MAPVKLNLDPDSLRDRYASADPFPHIVLDGLFTDADLDAVLREFPSPDQMRWTRFDNAQEKNLGFYHDSSTISDTVRRFLDGMNGSRCCCFSSGSPASKA